MITSSWKSSKGKDRGYLVCARVRKGGRKGTAGMELRGLKWLFPGANTNTLSKALGQPGVWSNITRHGCCRHECATCLLEAVPDYTVPGLQAEVQQGRASGQGATAHAHPGLEQPPKLECQAAQTRDPGLVALILA